MATTRAKFILSSVTKMKAWQGLDARFLYNLKFNVVGGNSEENKKFFAASPSGELNLNTVNESVAFGMEPGKEYYLDITPAEA